MCHPAFMRFLTSSQVIDSPVGYAFLIGEVLMNRFPVNPSCCMIEVEHDGMVGQGGVAIAPICQIVVGNGLETELGCDEEIAFETLRIERWLSPPLLYRDT